MNLDPYQLLVLKALGTVINLLLGLVQSTVPNNYAYQVERECYDAHKSRRIAESRRIE